MVGLAGLGVGGPQFEQAGKRGRPYNLIDIEIIIYSISLIKAVHSLHHIGQSSQVPGLKVFQLGPLKH